MTYLLIPRIATMLHNSPLNFLHLFCNPTCSFRLATTPILNSSRILRHVLLILYQIFVLLCLYLLISVLKAIRNLLSIVYALRTKSFASIFDSRHRRNPLQIRTLIPSPVRTFSINPLCLYAIFTSNQPQLVPHTSPESEIEESIEDNILPERSR